MGSKKIRDPDPFITYCGSCPFLRGKCEGKRGVEIPDPLPPHWGGCHMWAGLRNFYKGDINMIRPYRQILDTIDELRRLRKDGDETAIADFKKEIMDSRWYLSIHAFDPLASEIGMSMVTQDNIEMTNLERDLVVLAMSFRIAEMVHTDPGFINSKREDVSTGIYAPWALAGVECPKQMGKMDWNASCHDECENAIECLKVIQKVMGFFEVEGD